MQYGYTIALHFIVLSLALENLRQVQAKCLQLEENWVAVLLGH